MKLKAVIMDENAMNRAITRITYEILERNKGAENLCIIGIFSRGVIIAHRIAEKIAELEKISVNLGSLDITPYRDDLKSQPFSELNTRTDINFSIENKKVIIVDDVIYTGRSTRAAIDAVIERGRPCSIQLAVLVDRGHREIPVRPDYVGKNVPTSRNETVKVMVRELDGTDNAAIFVPEEVL